MKSFRHIMLLFVLFVVGNTYAQLPADSLLSRLTRQLELYPQEKVYVHNDKPYYIAGEDIWLRVHLVDAASHRHVSASRYVYGELVNPLDSVVDRVRIIRDDKDIYSGYFALSEALPAGTYTMRFYTRYMENQGEDYFFRKTLYIGGPLSSRYRIDPVFTFKDNNKVEVELSYIDIQTNEPFSPANIRYKDQTELKKLGINNQHKSRFTYDLNKSSTASIYLEFEYDNKKHSQYLSLPTKEDDFTVDFFPEGGHLFMDIRNKLSFKAINSQGLGEDVSVTIRNDKDEEVVTATSFHKGMGLLLFHPQPGQTYKAVCRNQRNITKEFALPQAQTTGYGLSVEPTAEGYNLSLLQPAGQQQTKIDNLILLVLLRGTVVLSGQWENAQETLTVDSKEMPSGILQFLLVDSDTQVPLSQRLAFVRNELETPQLSYSTNKNNYRSRDKVSLKLDIKDQEGKPLNGNLSVSVTDDKDLRPDTTQNIVSCLLLSSELKGYIEDPAYYLQNNRKTNHALDLLMQTQGWTRYDIRAVLAGELETPKIPLERTNLIKGNVKGGLFLHKGAKNVTLNVLTLQPMTVEQFRTDNDGFFTIEGYDTPDSTRFIITAKTKDEGDRLDLTVDSISYPDKSRLLYSRMEVNDSKQEEQVIENLNSYLNKAEKKYVIENGMRTINLKEVTVEGRMKRPQHVGAALSLSSPIYGQYHDTEDIKKKRPYSIKNLLEKLTGAVEERIDDEGRFTIFIKREKPFVIVDGRKDYDFLYNGHVDDIKDIEIVLPKEQDKPVYVLINLDWEKMYKRTEKLNIVRFKPLGYQPYKEFYVPKYETDELRYSTALDLRTTIHWQPSLEVIDGNAEIEFYTADEASVYSVVIEGMTEAGNPIHEIIKIERTE